MLGKKQQHPAGIPSLLFADERGEVQDYEGLYMAGSSAGHFALPESEDLIELPQGSELFILPQRLPVGIEPDGEPALLDTNPYEEGKTIQAVAAFMAPAHTAIHTAAYQALPDCPQLPLFAYTAVGWYDGKFWVSAFRSDSDCRQDAEQFDQDALIQKTQQQLKRFPHNRLIQHLGKCSLTYGCPAAKNYFLGRWEAPLPCSPVCNAACLGCISLQPSGCCPSTQERIKFRPTAKELAEVAIPHLKTAPRPVVSFGQGCEGEPLLQAPTMEKAITLIRQATDQGTINLNTNGSLPQAVSKLAQAGLDSIRISLNSAQVEAHTAYYQPQGFALADIYESMRMMREQGKFISLNYFILPGFTDSPQEFAALRELIHECKPDYIQLRNLNMDPEVYLQAMPQTSYASSGSAESNSPGMGMRAWLKALQGEFPDLGLGYFNPPLSG